MPSWDPQQYERFAAERARPFADLVGRVAVGDVTHVVDLGCGPGTMTATLADRWPGAQVLGLDLSPAMIAAAGPLARPGRLEFAIADVSAWRPEPASLDVIVSNAALQWVPGHLRLLAGWAAGLRPGGCLAFQVPVSVDMPATAAMRTVAAAPRWADRLAAAASGVGPRTVSPVADAETYVDALASLGMTVDAWQTTYYHLLPGPDPVLEWFAGTGLRPYLDALADDRSGTGGRDVDDFRDEVAARLRDVYPRHAYGTILPFPRLFVVAWAQDLPSRS